MWDWEGHNLSNTHFPLWNRIIGRCSDWKFYNHLICIVLMKLQRFWLAEKFVLFLHQRKPTNRIPPFPRHNPCSTSPPTQCSIHPVTTCPLPLYLIQLLSIVPLIWRIIHLILYSNPTWPECTATFVVAFNAPFQKR